MQLRYVYYFHVHVDVVETAGFGRDNIEIYRHVDPYYRYRQFNYIRSLSIDDNNNKNVICQGGEERQLPYFTVSSAATTPPSLSTT